MKGLKILLMESRLLRFLVLNNLIQKSITRRSAEKKKGKGKVMRML